MSFIELVLAEAIAAGMVRAALREARPPPENFFEIPPDPEPWRKISAACKEENMVICVEITDDSHPGSRRVQPMFMDLAREISQIPFFRAKITPIHSFAKLREDLGDIKYSPTIVAVFFADDGTEIRKAEGEENIRMAIRSGVIHRGIKDFIDKRIKLKIVEKMAERLLVGAIASGLMVRRRQSGDEYNEKLKKEMEELEKKCQQKGKDDEECKEMSQLSKRLTNVLDLTGGRKS